MKQKSLIALASVVAGVAFIGYIVSAPGDKASTPVASKQSEISWESLPKPAPISTSNSKPPQEDQSAKVSGASLNLAEDFTKATDWRAFALNALQKPQEGGYFYAALAASLCGTDYLRTPGLAASAISKASHKNGTISAEAIAMTEALPGKCASFTPNEAEELYKNIKEKSKDRKDPIVNAQGALLSALRAGEKKLAQEKLGELFALNDPVAPYSDGLLLRAMTAASKEMFFDGNTYSIADAQDQSVLTLALDIAACGDGKHCDLRTQMALACLSGQVCATDASDYVRQRYLRPDGLTSEQFDRVIYLSGRIQQAVGANNASAFIKP